MYDMQHSCGSVNKVVGLYKANPGSIHARHQKTKPEITSMTEWNGSLLNSPADSQKTFFQVVRLWLGGRVVGMLDLRSTGRGFESQPLHCRVQPGQVVNTHVPLSPSSIIWYQPNEQ